MKTYVEDDLLYSSCYFQFIGHENFKIQFEQKTLRKLYPAGPRLWHFVIGADVAVGGVFIALLLTPNQKYV